MANEVNSGTAQGLLAFCDYLVEKGYGGAAAVNALKSAAKQVFERVEGGPDFGGVDVTDLDVDDYMRRFETKARSDYKQESLASYRKRFERAVAYYRAFLEDGRVPQFRTTGSRVKSANAGEPSSDPRPRQRSREALDYAPSPALLDYPFPLQSGQLAYLRLPKSLTRADAQRIGAFVATLAVEPTSDRANPAED